MVVLFVKYQYGSIFERIGEKGVVGMSYVMFWNRNFYYFFWWEWELVEQIVLVREDGVFIYYMVDIVDGEVCFMQNCGDGVIWGQDSIFEVLFVKVF